MLDCDIQFINSLEQFERFKVYVSKLKPEYCVIDTETDGLNTKTAKLFGLGICFNSKYSFYIPWRKPDGSNYWSQLEQNTIQSYLVSLCQTIKLIGHNIIYDLLVLETNWQIDLTPHLYCDTILLKHTLAEDSPFGLKEVAVEYLGDWANKAQQQLYDNIKQNGGKTTKDDLQMWKADTAVLGEYCAWDVALTWRLFELFSKQLKDENLEQFFYVDEVMPLYVNVTIPMKRQGLPINVAYFNQLKVELNYEINKLEDEIMEAIQPHIGSFAKKLLDEACPIKNTGNFPKALAELLKAPLPVTKDGKVTLAKKAVELQKAATPEFDYFYDWILTGEVKDRRLSTDTLLKAQKAIFFERHPDQRYAFNLRSNDHLAHLFFNCMGLKPLEFTGSGKPQVDDEFLETNKDEHEEIAKLVDFKKLNKLSSTYINGILEREFEGNIYPDMLQFGTTSGRYASRNPNCLSMDTQVLTANGFKTYEELTSEDLVAAYSNNCIFWEKPKTIWKSPVQPQKMVYVKNIHFDMAMTDNHRVLYINSKSKKEMITTADKFPKHAIILHGATGVGGSNTSEEYFLRFLIAVQADAEIRMDSKRIRFVFDKKRKYERLLWLINKLNLKYEDKTAANQRGLYEILIDDIKDKLIQILGYDKVFPKDFVSLTPDCRQIFLDEIFYWDELSTRLNNYSSNSEQNVDIVQALCTLNGWRAHKQIYKTKANNNNYQIYITRKNYSYTSNAKITTKHTIESVWCLQVSSESFVVRRGSDVFITKNCQNLPRIKEDDSGLSPLVLKYTNAIKKGFVSKPGYKLIGADYSSLEPVCFAHMSNEEKIRDIFKTGKDLYSQVAIDVNKLHKEYSADKKADNFLKKHKPELRQLWKVPTLGIVYGMGESRLVEAIGCSYNQAKTIINGYLATYPNLKKYMLTCEFEAKKYGFVKTEFGRVRHLKQVKALYLLYEDRVLDYKWASDRGLTKERREYKNALNNAKNFKIQGLAASIVNRAAISLTKAFKAANIDGYIINQVHDELVCMVKEEQVEEAKKIMKHCMETTVNISVPLQAEPVDAYTWDEAK